MLTVEALEAAYGLSQVLFGVSFGIDAGQVVTLLGRNGMGKTTTVRTIMGILPARGGIVRFDGRPIHALPSYRIAQLGLGLVPEGRQIFPNLTVRENLVATAGNRRASRAPWTVDRVFELFPHLAARQKSLGAHLSGGEQQMLAIGRALMARPKVLLLDEPSLGLAPKLVVEIFRIIRSINADGVTVLLVEQNAYQALSIAHYSYVLRVGRVVLEGTAEEMKDRNDVVRSYLGRQTAE